jgi:hypothetical protein
VKVVVAKRDEARCGVCSSGRAEDVNAVLAAYLNGLPDPLDGSTKLTWPRMVERATILTRGKTSSERGLRRHLDGHCEVVTDERAAELAAQSEKGDDERDVLLEEIDRLLEAGSVSAAGLLSLQMKAYLLDLRQRVAAGERVQLGHEAAARSAERLMAAERKGQEAQLLEALTGGIVKAFERADQPQLPAGDEIVLEADAVRVEEAE